MKVLLVDDERDALDQADIYLEQIDDDINLETSFSARDALELLVERKFDAVVSDYRMPEMNGIQFLRELRNRGDDIPFIIFTSKGRKEVAIDALNLGADRYIQKKGDVESQYEVLAKAIKQEVKHNRTQKQLKESEEKFRTFTEQTPVVTVIAQGDKFVYANPAAEDILGYSRSELLDMNFWDPVHPDHEDKVKRRAFKRLEGKNPPDEYEIKVLTKKNQIRWAILRPERINYKGKEAILLTAQDITKRKKVRQELEEKEKRYRNLFENSPVGIYRTTPDGRIEMANSTIVDMLGFPSFDELAARSEDVGHPRKDRSRFRERIEENGRVNNLESIWERKDGTNLYALENAVVVRGEDDDEKFYEGTIEDITKRKKIERKFKTLFETSPDPICFLDDDARIINVNQAYEERLGYDREKITGQNIREIEFLSDESQKKILENFKKRRQGEDVSPYTVHAMSKDGEDIWAELNVRKVEEDGEIQGFIVVGRDVTERKRAKKEMEKSQKKFEEVVETAQELIFRHDLEGNITYANPSAADKTGYSTEELTDLNVYDLIPEEDKNKIKELEIARRNGDLSDNRLECDIKRKDGTTFSVEAISTLIMDSGEPRGELVVGRDITERKRTEEELRESEERYRKLVEYSPLGIAVHKDGRCVFLNKVGADILGLDSPDEAIGASIMDVVHDDYRDLVKERMDKMREKGDICPSTEEKFIRIGDGEPIDVEVAAARVTYEGEKAIQVVFEDITERKKVEEELKKNQDRYKSVVEGTPYGIVVYNKNGLKFINPAGAEILGMDDPEEYMGDSIVDVVHPDYRQMVTDQAMDQEDEGVWTPLHEEKFIRMDDGEIIDVEVTGSAIDFEGERSVMAIFRDITERKQAEKRFQRLFESIPDWAMFIDQDRVVREVNEKLCDHLEMDKDEILDNDIEEFLKHFPRDSEKKVLKNIDMHEEGKDVSPYMIRYPKGDKEILLEVNSIPLKGIGDVFRGVINVARDVTEREMAKKELQEQKESYRTLFENSLIGIYRTTPDGDILKANPAILDMLGYESFEELSGYNLEENGNFGPGYPREKFKRRLREEGSITGLESVWKRKDGSNLYVRESAVAVTDDDGDVKYYEGTVEDISKRKEMEDALRESKRRFSTLLSNLPGIVYRCKNEASWPMEFISEGCEELTGYKPEELENSDELAYGELIHPDDKGIVWEEVQDALEEDEPYELTYRIITASDETKWIWEQGRGVRDEKGNIKALEGFITDITERKIAKQRERFLHSLLRHDVKNKIKIIEGYLDLWEKSSISKEKFYNRTRKVTDDCSNLIQKVRTLTEVNTEEKKAISVMASLDTAIDEKSSLAEEKGIDLTLDINRENKFIVEGGPLLKELFSNIIENSIKHAECDEIKFSIEDEDGMCIVKVQDDGKGIPEEKQDKIFDKNFKHGENAGSGLGLYLVKRIIETYDGDIEVKDSEMGGACFEIKLTKADY